MNTSAGLSSVSVRARSARTLFLCAAAALATPLLTASAAHAAYNWGIHVKGSGWGVWIDTRDFLGGSQLFSSVSPTGDAGRSDFDFTGALDASMGLTMDLPDGTTATGADVTRVDGNLQFGGGLGTDVLQDYRIEFWIRLTKDYRICVIIDTGSSGSLSRTSIGPGGLQNYEAIGLSLNADFLFEHTDGTQTFEQRAVTELQWSSPAQIPAPATAALLGIGALAGVRRRRAAA